MNFLKINVKILVIFLLCIFIYANFDFSNIIYSQLSSVYLNYTNNSTISLIYKTAIVLDIFMALFVFVSLIFEWRKDYTLNRIFKIFIAILSLISIILIWYELYYGSTFYYGEIRDKQGLPFMMNNLGLIGSIMFSLIFLKIIVINNIKIKRINLFFLFTSISVIFLHFLLYELLKANWKLE